MQLIKKFIYHPIKNFIAKYYLVFLRTFGNIKVIGITGSAGKTTTKEMLASVLSIKEPTVWSKDNIDPVYNIASTILRCTPKTRYLILEMGIEYPNEMDFYLSIVKPDIGVITNIFPTHTKFLKDVEGVLKEKSKLVTSLSEDSYAVLNSGDKLLKGISDKIRCNVHWFLPSSDPLVQNMNTVKVVSEILNVSDLVIKKGLNSYQKPKHRFEVLKHESGAVVYDDSYNSNPEAAISSLNFFEKIAKGKRKIAVLGDMLELGDYEKEGHVAVAREVIKLNFDVVIGVGDLSRIIISEVNKRSPKVKTYQYYNSTDVIEALNPLLKKGNAIFIKGSRSMKLDRLVALLFD